MSLILYDGGLPKKETQKIETDIFNYRSKELFINLKETDIPPIGHPDRDAFIDYEEEKCLLGVNVSGQFIPGTFYWDINHWAIMKDIKDNRGIKKKKAVRPDIRDNDWMIHNALHECETSYPKLNLQLATARQISKSKNIASIFGCDLMLHDGRINLLMASAEIYLMPILEYLQIGTENCTDFFRVPRLTRDKKSKLWKWGFKTKEGEDIVKSMLHIRNAQEGKNTEVAAGVTIDRAAIDEIAVYPYRSSYETILPALVDQDGIRSSSLVAFTGGNAEKSKDAQESFYNPEAGKFKSFTNQGKQTGFFIGGWYRQDLKEEANFGEWLGIEDKSSELYDLKIRVTDLDKANKILDDEELLASKSADPAALTKQKMYNPRKIEDMFLTENKNPFDVEGLKRHKEYLLANSEDKYVDLHKDADGTIRWNPSNKQVIKQYPITDKNLDLDAPIVIYDFPKYTEFYSLHVIGFDPINKDESMGDSLASVYVMRRLHSDLTDSYINTMVASYTARPKSFTRTFLKNVELLQEYYNAQILHEDSGNSVTMYFDRQQKSHVLMDTFNLQSAMNPRSKSNSKKGLAANGANNKVRLEVVIDYVEEELEGGVKGYTRIKDPMLLEELIAFDGIGKDSRNTDRVDAFGLALLQTTSLEKYNKTRPFIVNRPKVEKKNIQTKGNALGINMNYYKKR